MSNWKTKPVPYSCDWDCKQSGCPGHLLVIEHHLGSDTMTILTDGYPLITVSYPQMRAMKKATEQAYPK